MTDATKFPGLILISLLAMNGCATHETYTAADGVTAVAAKPKDYPICVYPEEKEVPRQFETLGTARVGGTLLTMRGEALEDEMAVLQGSARQKGADAIKITTTESPGFTSAASRVDAEFIRFTDTWESFAVSEAAFTAYLKTNAGRLDPIEGVWLGNDLARTRIGIMQNSSKRGRDLVGFVLSTKNSAWQEGQKKLELARGERPMIYRFSYFADDYEEKWGAFTLGEVSTREFTVTTSEDGDAVTFIKQ